MAAASPARKRHSQTRLSKATLDEVNGALKSLVEEQRKTSENISRLETSLHVTERRLVAAFRNGASQQDGPDRVLNSVGTNSYQTFDHIGSSIAGGAAVRGGGGPLHRNRLASLDTNPNSQIPLMQRTLSDSDTAVSWGKGHRPGEVRNRGGLSSLDSHFFFAEEDEAAESGLGKNLPPQWPSCLLLRQELNKDSTDAMGSMLGRGLSPSGGSYHHAMLERRGFASLFTSNSAGQVGSVSQSLSLSEAGSMKPPFWTRMVVNPDSVSMQFKDFIGFLVLMHDLIVTPYLISWDQPVEGTLQYISWVAASYWSIDLILNFMVSFHRAGEFITTQPDIAIHYLRTRFVFDFSLISLDLLSIIMDATDEKEIDPESRAFLRVAKLMRLLKVARLIRLFWLLEKTSQAYLSKENSINMNLLIQAAKVIFALFMSTHILACIWYLAGNHWPSDTEKTWVSDAFGSEGPEAFSPSFQYLTALHWTVAQVTLGSSHVVPTNSSELMFNIVLLVTGLLAGSTFVSLFSAKIVEHTASKRDQAVLIDNLQRFLRQNNIDRFLSRRALNQVRQRILEEDKLGEDDVPALTMLSPALRQELLFETRLPHLLSHDLFRVWAEVDVKTLAALCDVVKFRFLLPQDELFVAGEPAAEGYFLIKGRLEYTQSPTHSMQVEDSMTVCPELSWLCEAALWAHWIHVGDAQAITMVHLMSMNAEGLGKAIASMPREVRIMSLAYGKRYHALVSHGIPPFAEYPTDLQVSHTENMAELFNPRATLYFFRQLMREERVQLRDDEKFKIEREIKKGICSVRRSTERGLERITATVVLKLSSSDGRVLYRLGVKKEADECERTPSKHKINAKLGLPEASREPGELLHAAVERMLVTELACFGQWVEVISTTFFEYPGRGAGTLPTVDLQTLHVAHLTQALENLVLPTCHSTQALNIDSTIDDVVKEVYIIPSSEHEFGMYAWMPEEEFETLAELLENDNHRRSFESWLESFNTNEAETTSWGLKSPFTRDGSDADLALADFANNGDSRAAFLPQSLRDPSEMRRSLIRDGSRLSQSPSEAPGCSSFSPLASATENRQGSFDTHSSTLNGGIGGSSPHEIALDVTINLELDGSQSECRIDLDEPEAPEQPAAGATSANSRWSVIDM